MAEHVYIKKEPKWCGEERDAPLPSDDQEAKDDVPGRGELRGIDQISQSSYSAAVNLAHGAARVKEELQVATTDVDFDRIIPQFVCAPDVDPLRVSGRPPTVSCLEATPTDNPPIKREPPTTEAGESSHADHQGDHGLLSSPVCGKFNFCPVVGAPYIDGDCKREPGEVTDETAAFDSSSDGSDRVAPVQAMSLRAKKAKDAGKHTCDVCGKELGSPLALKQHAVLHGSVIPVRKHRYERFVVVGRSDVPTPGSNLSPPTKEQTKPKPFACDLCAVTFTTRGHLTAHKKIHSGEKKFGCNVCGACFLKSSCLIRHKRSHTGDRPFTCDECGSRFSQRSGLTTHKRIHAGEKLYACDLCGSRFTQSSTLKTHKQIHAGVKPYSCDVCGARFTRTSDLKTHTRKHTGETPYACEACEARFTLKSNLVKHRRTHTGEKPYACDSCEARFTQIGNLAKHKKIHTRDNPYACDVCHATFTGKFTLTTHKRIHTSQ